MFWLVRRMIRIAVVVAIVVAGWIVLGHGLAGAAPTRAGAVVSESSSALLQTVQSDPAWLVEINKYRLAAGLNPVTDNTSWDAALAAHLAYLANTPASYRTGVYANDHTENPASPWYSAAGAQAAADSNLYAGAVGFTPLDFIDGWLAAPFHAVGILRPGLQQVAFVYNSTTGDAGLNVISGLADLTPPTTPVLFPGPGVTTHLMAFGGELPNPLQTCGWTGAAGLPLIALLPTTPADRITATVAGPGGVESTAASSVCVVDQWTYTSTNEVYGPTGMDILQSDNAVFLIPRSPLTTGTYTATINQPGESSITWSFSAVAPVPNFAPPGQIVDIASTPSGNGYWTVDTDGFVGAYGAAVNYGGMGGQALNAPISHIVSTPDGLGYWLVAGDGGVFCFGDAQFYGSMGGHPLNAPVMDIIPTSNGGGYWLVATDGGVFAFGNAQFYGSMGGHPLNAPVNGGSAAQGGYRMVANDGGIFDFGGAQFYGSMGGHPLNQPIVGMADTPDGAGYWEVASDGGIFTFGDAQFYGSTGGDPPSTPVVGMAVDDATGGYWLVDQAGQVFSYNAAAYTLGG